MAGSPQPARPRPVWFEATADGTIQLSTPSDSVKLRRLRRDPRASVVVAAPPGERERRVSVTGQTAVEAEGARDLAERLAARHWDLDERADDLAAMVADELVRIVLHPEQVRRFAF
ncbi:pyridoxamine 5'-phosphate oxidase family protein [Actinomadura sp. 7K534]|uniref:pyridoxamine 5'-phosphate oxidase family protein n=1 Tax=Actinomadura sp. 7K534 TaxID=2530366 RepID=UPI001A9E9BEF|nr:pyridoxamine 5'-phosphate oxidase family protein [Actinomadura sp. 7K534]